MVVWSVNDPRRELRAPFDPPPFNFTYIYSPDGCGPATCPLFAVGVVSDAAADAAGSGRAQFTPTGLLTHLLD